MNKAQTTNEAALVEIEAVHHTKDDGCLRTIIMIERITKKDEIQIKINNMEILWIKDLVVGKSIDKNIDNIIFIE